MLILKNLIGKIMPNNSLCHINPYCPKDCPIQISTEDEKSLTRRYEAAYSKAKEEVKEIFDTFEKAIGEKSYIVINLKITDLYELTNPLQRYKNIYQQPGKTVEVKRQKIDNALFGKYGKEIYYAALSLDGWGLVAWGPCTIRLNIDRICDRVSLLQENSYSLCIINADEQISFPEGHRSTWEKRHQLAVAKLACKITPDTQTNQFAELLMNAVSCRAKADFIEVHICGSFTKDMIQEAGLMSQEMSEDEEVRLNVIIDRLGEQVWIGHKD